MTMTDKPAQLMIVDDEHESLRSMSTLLRIRGFSTPIIIDDPKNTLNEIADKRPEIVMLDLHMPGLSGQTLLATIKEDHPDIIVIIITADDQIEMAVKCIQLGAYDYFVKPIDQTRLIHVLKKALEDKQLKDELVSIQKHLFSGIEPSHHAFAPILTNSDNMLYLFRYIEAISNSSRPVLILGETGTGKELFANAIHEVSEKTGKLVSVNIAGFDEVALSDNIFGHTKGAFTGAQKNREGLINKAQSGTLFLDEIGDLSSQSQIKLLRLLQENNYYPLGSDSLVDSTARIISATHQDLEALVEIGEFRRDLFFRLKVHTITIPPLRDRRDDIPLLTEHFLEKVCAELQVKIPRIPVDLYSLFEQHPFLGNLRELEMLLYDAVIHTRGKQLDTVQLLKHLEKASRKTDRITASDEPEWFSSVTELPTIKKATENLINEALKRTSNNQKKASSILGISRQALNKRLVRRPDSSEALLKG